MTQPLSKFQSFLVFASVVSFAGPCITLLLVVLEIFQRRIQSPRIRILVEQIEVVKFVFDSFKSLLVSDAYKESCFIFLA